VEIHRASIMEKLHARNLSHVVRTALAASWEIN
jgi:FixJ family two-component response regulator